MKTNDYYNTLAPYYKYIYQDWEESIAKQSVALNSIITEFFGDRKNILDVSCGIGTQSLGLAELGYQVSASDLSEEEVKLAKSEAEKRGLEITFKVADMREVSKYFEGRFDIVLSADNSIPHLLNDEDILRAFKEFHSLTNSGGGCIVTVRDYKNINPENQKEILNPRRIHHTPEGKIVMFDLWEFEGDHYDLNTYLVKDEGSEKLETIAMRSRYYCVSTDKLGQLMKMTGFSKVQTLRERFYPSKTRPLWGRSCSDFSGLNSGACSRVFDQPVIIGHKK